MESRCYRGGENRTRMKQLEMHSRDYVAATLTVALIIVLFAVRQFKY